MSEEQMIVELDAKQADRIRRNCNALLDVVKAMDNLLENPDFQKVFKFYTEDEPVRITTLFAVPEATVSEKKNLFIEDLHKQLEAISRFRYFCLNKIPFMRDQVNKQLDDLNNAVIR